MTMCMLGFSAYDSNFRKYLSNGVNDNNSDMWDAANNAVNFHCKDTATGSWSDNSTYKQVGAKITKYNTSDSEHGKQNIR